MADTTDTLFKDSRRYDRLLSNHGYLVSRAPEVMLMKPCSDPVTVGSHLRWMCHEVFDGDLDFPLQAERWLSFVRGGLFCLGVLSLEEIVTEFREAYEEEG